MLRLSSVAIALFAVGMFAATVAAAEPRHPHLHHALYEMREAHKELKEAGHDFGGHKERALEALDAAIIQTEKALAAADDHYKDHKPVKAVYADYKNHAHLRHALVEMGKAHTELKEAKHDFGGHREKAIKDLDVAMVQVEKCIAHVK